MEMLFKILAKSSLAKWLIKLKKCHRCLKGHDFHLENENGETFIVKVSVKDTC